MHTYVHTDDTEVMRGTKPTFLEVAKRVFEEDPFWPNPAIKILAKETYISLRVHRLLNLFRHGPRTLKDLVCTLTLASLLLLLLLLLLVLGDQSVLLSPR